MSQEMSAALLALHALLREHPEGEKPPHLWSDFFRSAVVSAAELLGAVRVAGPLAADLERAQAQVRELQEEGIRLRSAIANMENDIAVREEASIQRLAQLRELQAEVIRLRDEISVRSEAADMQRVALAKECQNLRALVGYPLRADAGADGSDGSGGSGGSGEPLEFYWQQCYGMPGGHRHWALRDTQTDREGGQRVTCGYMVLLADHANGNDGKPVGEQRFPALIARLLTEHFAKKREVQP